MIKERPSEELLSGCRFYVCNDPQKASPIGAQYRYLELHADDDLLDLLSVYISTCSYTVASCWQSTDA